MFRQFLALGTTLGTDSMEVFGGKAFIVGDGKSGVAREFDDWGPFRWINKDGRLGNPRLTLVSGQEQEIASGTINAQNAAQQLTLIPGMDSCRVTKIIFANFSATPSINLEGGIFAAPPVGSTNQTAAAILADTTKYNDWPGGYFTLEKAAIPSIRHLVGLWWCPKTVSPTALTFDVFVQGVPKWQEL